MFLVLLRLILIFLTMFSKLNLEETRYCGTAFGCHFTNAERDPGDLVIAFTARWSGWRI